jgi:anti-sigma factor RsiW
VADTIPHGAQQDDGLVDRAAARRYDLDVSGRSEGTPDVEPHLTLPPSAAERVAALEAERDRERAAIKELEAKLAEAAANRAVIDERNRFRGMIPLGFFLGVMFVIVFFGFVLGSVRR